MANLWRLHHINSVGFLGGHRWMSREATMTKLGLPIQVCIGCQYSKIKSNLVMYCHSYTSYIYISQQLQDTGIIIIITNC